MVTAITVTATTSTSTTTVKVAETASTWGGSLGHRSPDCQVECEQTGIAAPCSDWIMWAGQHHRSGRLGASACTEAHALVLKHCPMCASCTAADACQRAPASTTTAASADGTGDGACAGWRAGRQEWCCTHRSIGCQGRREVLNSCAHGLQREESFLTPARRKFCCRHLPDGPGCPRRALDMDMSDMVLPVSLEECRSMNSTSSEWPTLHQDWCCLHESLKCGADLDFPFDLDSDLSAWPSSTTTTTRTGTTTTVRARSVGSSRPSASLANAPARTAAAPFDCDVGLEDWANRWSLSKLRWCCSLGSAPVHARLSRDSACLDTIREYGAVHRLAQGERRPLLPAPGLLCAAAAAVLAAPLALRPLAARLR
ncbi:unnamed protein product, partial [Prorocentrum cordatum]